MANQIPLRYAQSILRIFDTDIPTARELLANLRLPEQLLNDDAASDTANELWLNATDFGRFFMALVKQAQPGIVNDPASAEDVVDLSTWRLMYSYILQARTLGAAIERAASYYRRFESAQRGFDLQSDGDSVLWRFDPQNTDASETDQQHFAMDRLQWLPGVPGKIAALYTWHRLCSWMTGHFIDLEQVLIDAPRDGSAQHLEHIFRSQIYFNAPDCGLRLQQRYLDLPIVRNETDLEQMLATFPAELLTADSMADSYTAQVRGLLGQDFAEELPGLEAIAERINMSTTTLHRRLRNEGTSFQKIKDECRRDAAIRWLREEQYSGSEIAALLGFSDPSTFFRAFKKWTGTTPQSFLANEN